MEGADEQSLQRAVGLDDGIGGIGDEAGSQEEEEIEEEQGNEDEVLSCKVRFLIRHSSQPPFLECFL